MDGCTESCLSHSFKDQKAKVRPLPKAFWSFFFNTARRIFDSWWLKSYKCNDEYFISLGLGCPSFWLVLVSWKAIQHDLPPKKSPDMTWQFNCLSWGVLWWWGKIWRIVLQEVGKLGGFLAWNLRWISSDRKPETTGFSRGVLEQYKVVFWWNIRHRGVPSIEANWDEQWSAQMKCYPVQ